MFRMGSMTTGCSAGMLLLVCQFVLWRKAGCGYVPAAVVAPPPTPSSPPPRDPARHVSTAGTCEELREALEDPGPSGDVFMVEDIWCDSSSWGGDPVILSSHVTIIGIRAHPTAMPTLTFEGIMKGIVVTGTARLVLQTINFHDYPSQDMLNEESPVPRPPSAVAVHKNGVIDFVGSWVCCDGCGLAQRKVYVDHVPVSSELGDDNGTQLVEKIISTGGIETLQGSGAQEPSSLDGVHSEWHEGSFASGGVYHICASTMICKPDPNAYSAFNYFVDEGIDVCKSRPTIIVLHSDTKRGSETPMVMHILAISVPSLVCITLLFLFLGFLWRSHAKKKGNSIATQSRESSQAQQDTSQASGFRSNSRACGFQSEEQLRLRHQSSQSNSERESATSFSFGGIRVDLAKLLGRGGFSSVYKGTFQGNVAAIKIVEHSLQSKAGSSGELAEAKLHRDLYHPYIVITYCCETIPVDSLPSNYSLQGSPTISLGLSSSTSPGKIILSSSEKASWNNSSEGTPEKMCTLIVMEYCERGNLFEAIHDCEFFRQGIRGAPDLPIILRAALDVAAAMCYLHSKGVVHGDLKPENVLRKTVAEDDRGYICKVSDFGLSRTVLVDNLVQTATKGTITHMPPEVLQDGLLSPSTDVYSFGIMLWEMISGGFPFNAMGQKDIMLAVVGGARPPMPTFITPNIWALIQQCWDGDYKKRPSFVTISGVLQREFHYLSTESSPAYPGLYSTTPAGSQEQSEFRLHPISNSIADSGSIILSPYGSLATSMTNGVGLGDVSSSANETGLLSGHAWPEEHVTQELNQLNQRAQIAPSPSTLNSPLRSQMGSGEVEDSMAQPGVVRSPYWNGPEAAQQSSANTPQEQVNQLNSNPEEFGCDHQAQETPYVHTTDDSLVDTGQGFRDERTIGSLFANGRTIAGWRRFRSLGPNSSAISLPTTDNGTAMTTVSVCEDDIGLIEQFPQ